MGGKPSTVETVAKTVIAGGKKAGSKLKTGFKEGKQLAAESFPVAGYVSDMVGNLFNSPQVEQVGVARPKPSPVQGSPGWLSNLYAGFRG